MRARQRLDQPLLAVGLPLPRSFATAANGLLLVINSILNQMNFTITIPENLVPGITATSIAESARLSTTVTAQMVVQQAAIEAATRVCQDLMVGPYFVGPILPQFNQDGTPYSPE